MATYTINEKWYNEIKDRVPHREPHFFTEEGWQLMFVEVEVQEDIFLAVSTKLGWI